MRVFEHGRADAVFAGDGFEACDGDVETRGLGGLRGKEAELHFTGLPGLGAEGEREHGGLRRVRGNLQLQELEEEFAIGGGEGGTYGALISAVAVELHFDDE